MEGGGGDTGAPAANRAEIDTSAPFRSVKEAVALFGERVLAGHVYANKFAKGEDVMRKKKPEPTSELEEAKESLRKAQLESIQMARSISSLQHELENTKLELELLKTQGHNDKRICDSEILKFVEDSTEQRKDVDDHHRMEKKRYVSFANPPAAEAPAPAPAQARAPPGMLRRHSSVRITRKKWPLPSFIEGLLTKKKGGTGGGSSQIGVSI